MSQNGENGDPGKTNPSSRAESSGSGLTLLDYDAAGDAQLLERVGRADIVALGVLYWRHAPRLYTALLELESQPARADALLCDVFLDVWKRYAWPVDGRPASHAFAFDEAAVQAVLDRSTSQDNGHAGRTTRIQEALAASRDGEPVRPPAVVRRRLMRRLGHPEVDREARASGLAARVVTVLAVLVAVSLTGWWILR